MATRRAVAVVAAVTLLGCSGPRTRGIALDGSPHVANDAGVVTEVDRQHLVLDGQRRYGVSPHLQAFLPDSLRATALLGTSGRYVLVGLSGRTAVWLEALSEVIAPPGEPPTVVLFATLRRFDAAGRAIFTDGTVLPTVPGLARALPLGGPRKVRADIDPTSHDVRDLAVLAE